MFWFKELWGTECSGHAWSEKLMNDTSDTTPFFRVRHEENSSTTRDNVLCYGEWGTWRCFRGLFVQDFLLSSHDRETKSSPLCWGIIKDTGETSEEIDRTRMRNRLWDKEGKKLPWQLVHYKRRPNYSTLIVPEITHHIPSPISCTVSRDTPVIPMHSQ